MASSNASTMRSHRRCSANWLMNSGWRRSRYPNTAWRSRPWDALCRKEVFMCKKFEWLLSAAILMCGAPVAFAQPPDFPPGGFGGRGPGGPGGMGQHVKIVERFDKEGKGYLNAAERKAAREYLAANPRGRGGRGRGF